MIEHILWAIKGFFKFIWSIITSPVKLMSNKTLARRFFRYYILVIGAGAALLFSPIAVNGYIRSNGEPYRFIDALFTAASAFSDTGLVVTNTYEQFTFVGQLGILILILMGGIGFMAIRVIVWSLIGKKIGLQERLLIQEERGSSKLGGTYDLIKTAIQVIMIFILLGTLLLWPYMYLVDQSTGHLAAENPVNGDILKSLWHAIFHATSAINNAGFDITGANSIGPYYDDLYVQIVFVVLLIAGGIGFPVFYDFKRWVRCKREKRFFKWSLFTKLTVFTYVIVFFAGLGVSLVSELASSDPNSIWQQALAGTGNYTPVEVIKGIVFSVFSTRNAGFATIPMHHFNDATKFIWSIMMWIGSSPASTAGGVRTTTFAIAILAMIATAKGGERVYVFKRRVPKMTVRKSLVAIFVSLMIVFSGTIFILTWTGGQIIDPVDAFFEVSSAFGTTGLSAGLTAGLGTHHKIAIIIIMIIGQLGITTTLSIAASGKHFETKYKMANEDVPIG